MRLVSRLAALGAVVVALAPAGGLCAAKTPLFQPTQESVKQYKCPEWFRDAKFGIWAVWGPESVPMQGDWYAHYLYVEGHRQNQYHIQHYGHPSQFGFKDIIPLWKAEKWDPDKLMALYKKAGAKYFCMIAEHHDNFDCWDSKYQKWNSVKYGPKRDIAGEWQKAAQKYGLRFGMTEHLAASWWFYSTAKQSDKNGQYAGVPYDGTDPRYSDLYWRGNENPPGAYYIPGAPDFVKRAWFDRITDMIDHYHPDLLYSDSPLPYPDEYGLKMLSHFYNSSIEKTGGRLEAVYTCKQGSEGRWVQDLERGVMGEIRSEPWQTDTCVGDWYYYEDIYNRHQYKTAGTILCMLADIVSKNGNLLLNFPPRPDGTLDDDELKILSELAAWMPVNGEAIFGTRPSAKYGEGPSRTGSGGFNEGGLRYTASDVRFTTKGKNLYALLLGWPADGRVAIGSLAASAGRIKSVSLLGSKAPLRWKQTATALVVELPEQKPCDYVYALKIAGNSLQPAEVSTTASAQPDGSFVLKAADATIHGGTPMYENDSSKDQIGYWGSAEDYVYWKLNVTRPGTYAVSVTYSCEPAAAGSEFMIECGSQRTTCTSRSSGSWSSYVSDDTGKITLEIGTRTLSVKPKADKVPWRVIGLKSVVLTEVKP